MKQYFKEFVHNAIVHPLMMFIPRDWAHHMHDVNAQWAFGSNRFDEIGIEEGMKSLGGNNDNTPSTAHSIPATELASLREKAAMVDELQKRAERMQKALSDIAEWTDRYTTPGHPVRHNTGGNRRMSDSEMSPASETSDVHRLVRREL